MCWFRSDLTQKNIGILRTERPDTEFVHTMNKIRIVMNKQGVILGDSKLEITDQIISIINKEVSSLKIQ